MTQTEGFIQRLQELQEGDRSLLRRLAGRHLDETVPGFDLFTGLWWPLRQQGPRAPRRETSWLVAKLYVSFRIRHVRPDNAAARPTLPRVLGWCEPRDSVARDRSRRRFDALLQSPLSTLESHLRWALSTASDAVVNGRTNGIDWVQLLDDLSIWERGERNIRDRWAGEYLDAVHYQQGGVEHVD